MPEHPATLLIATATVFVVLCQRVVHGEEKASLLLLGGKIITVDAAFSIHRAMAVKGDRILAVGGNEEVKRYQGPATQVIQLEGRAVMPGLIDTHTHPASAAIIEFDHPIPQMECIADVLDYIRSRVKVLGDGKWIWISQVFLTRLKEARYPTRAELDAVAPRNPVVFQTGPDASVNTLALKLSGIDKNWKVSDGGYGHAEKDPQTGEPTGILRSCTRSIKHVSSTREPTPEQHAELLKKLLADYNRVGITAVGERDVMPSEVALYRRLYERGELTARVSMSCHVETIQPLDKIQADIEEIARSPLLKGDNMLRAPAAKFYMDGGMLTGSAYMRQPWGVSKFYNITDPNYRGVRFIPEDRLVPIIESCMKNGVQFAVHSVGDGAVHAILDACIALADRYDLREKRPVICHSNFMSAEAVDLAAKYGVCLEIQPAWLHLDARTLTDHFGYDRLTWFQPLRSLFAVGAPVGGGSDHMQKIGSLRSNNFYDPWLAMWVAMTRRAKWLDHPVHPEQALGRVEVIRFYTINGAYIQFAERDRGSLEAGKLADFIILEDDILTCPLDRVKDIKVSRTYLGGRVVYGS
jgi:predicted amidohydrolase YtcJ